MTQEERELLYADICARLPYAVKAKCTDIHSIDNLSVTETDIQCVTITSIDPAYGPIGFDTDDNFGSTLIDNIRPYLRTMSSMTEEEKEVLCELCEFFEPYNDRDDFSHYGIEIIEEFCVNDEKIPLREINYKVIDWLNSHYFDYRNLIEKGLAIEAPEGMYKTE